jgi:hypothetical protein
MNDSSDPGKQIKSYHKSNSNMTIRKMNILA